jgi:hypothetical protein
MQGESEAVLASPSVSGDTTLPSSSLRLLLHVQDNKIAYLIGVLVAHQIGILDKLWTYGSGVCI